MKKAEYEKNEAEQRWLISSSAMSPHKIYTPALYHDGLEWVCVWGTTPESQLVGRGKNPSQALLNFDLAWLGAEPSGDE